jgi:hypothetical protein
MNKVGKFKPFSWHPLCIYEGVSKSSKTRMYLLDLSLGGIPFKIVPLCSSTSIPALLPLLKRAGSPALEVYEEHFAIPSGSPPPCQSSNPLAAASCSGRGRSCKGPNLVSKADVEV